jgi:hypothetical protein
MGKGDEMSDVEYTLVKPADLSPEMLAQAAEILGVTEEELLADKGCEEEETEE